MQMVSSFFVFIDIGIGARTVIPLMRAARRQRRVGIPSLALTSAGQSEATGSVLMEGRDLVYQYPGRGEPVLRRCDLRIAAGDRVLLEGASGSGKSTLGSLLTGLRQPSSGVLLLQGLDPQSLGEAGWRRRVVGVPQFHENYIFTGTLAHNLLMGNRWPSTDDDIDAAEELCRELGLGSLIDRMPSGMQTIVGESGWQLSHGERSRVYLARGLLQQSEVVVLDESFAALDPETLDVCMRAVLARSSTLVLIAHP